MLKQLREAKNYTQQELADACEVSRSTISMIENGVNNPSLKLAKKICSVLDCTYEELLD